MIMFSYTIQDKFWVYSTICPSPQKQKNKNKTKTKQNKNNRLSA